MYFGPFYFDTKEVFLILLVVLLALAMWVGYNPTWFTTRDIFTITIIILFTKGLLPAIHNEAFFFVAIAALFLTIYLPVFQVVLFYFTAFVFLRFLRVV
jgi:hypothetical protein